MTLRAAISNLWTRLTVPPVHRSSSAWARAWLTGRDDTLPTAATLRDPFTQSTWVYSCITALAENVSSIPFRIITGPEDNERVVQSHPALDLFDSPHPQTDRFQFWELIVTWLCLRGEAFILPITDVGEPSYASPPHSAPPAIANQKSQIKNLVILNPDHLHEVIHDHRLFGWRYNCTNRNGPIRSTVFLPEELIHIKLPTPFNFWRGMSPLTVAWLAAQTDYASSQFMKGTMINNADTGLIVTTAEQLSPEQREQFTAALRERKRSAGMADRTIFLSGGAKVEKPTISAVDLQFLENRKFNRQEICAIYKVPQELLGFTEDANRSVSDAARLNFMENRIAPLCARLEAGISPIVHRFDPRVRGEFHIKGTPIMQAAQRARVDTAAKLFALGVPMNTVNRVLDLGLPTLPHGDTAYLPSKLQKVGGALSPSPDSESQSSEGRAPRATAPSEIPNLKSEIAAPLARCAELLSLLTDPSSPLLPSVRSDCPGDDPATESSSLEHQRESCLLSTRDSQIPPNQLSRPFHINSKPTA